ncbi:helix-turn-helix domain-containing protein [Alicyclobacillus kakegawensis]|uniref:helix-turn-helix domain-containing protein n=1 Tax=Alicyclobacillus kakegawensis TaxID=392012 RepID=UPI0009FAC6D0|nr:helix-turn-helix transcriptional regulator [Alicyclobacillus kakegawensis]
MSSLGKRLCELRQQRNIKQREMAEFLGVTLRAWQRYEAGDREPTIDQLIQLADFFDVSLDYLVGRSDNPQGR